MTISQTIAYLRKATSSKGQRIYSTWQSFHTRLITRLLAWKHMNLHAHTQKAFKHASIQTNTQELMPDKRRISKNYQERVNLPSVLRQTQRRRVVTLNDLPSESEIFIDAVDVNVGPHFELGFLQFAHVWWSGRMDEMSRLGPVQPFKESIEYLCRMVIGCIARASCVCVLSGGWVEMKEFNVRF